MILLRIEQFGNIPLRSQRRGEISESIKMLFIREFSKEAWYKINVLK